MTTQYVQEYLNKLPEGQDYGFQILTEGGWKDTTILICYHTEWIKVPDMTTYDEAYAKYRKVDDTCRVVKYSRYLANKEFVVHNVKNYKEQLR